MILRTPRPTPPDTLVPYTTLFRSLLQPQQAGVFRGRGGHTRSCLHIRDVLLDDPSHTGGDREEGASGAAATDSDELGSERRRPEECRVRNECDSTCSDRRSACHETKKNTLSK